MALLRCIKAVSKCIPAHLIASFWSLTAYIIRYQGRGGGGHLVGGEHVVEEGAFSGGAQAWHDAQGPG